MSDFQYEDLLRSVLEDGDFRPDRTGTGTYGIFGAELRYDLSFDFPLITTKKVHFKSVVGELLWFLSGNTNTRFLNENGIRIWNEWADQDGQLGPVYGAQWRAWPGRNGSRIDQIAELIENLKSDPFSRRHIVSAWNVSDLDQMALAPCHMMMQFHVREVEDMMTGGHSKVLSCKVIQRSADMFLGVPFNIASYALLVHMIAQQVGMGVGELIWSGGDVHVYSNHIEQVESQLKRKILPFPKLILKPADSIDDYTFDHVELVGYNPHPAIKAPVAV
ncbi:thymidylate synthase [Rhodococcus qingshengii]|uniref:Thymidylate synthase n=1 Tax=Rhodococcus qingshengii TaxID=334542 RepID=A0AAW6LN50_RHOSG|nr:thymidylate synthase [Rhodococcus qingshengii]MDE8648149.1 thymidylate synthase [Rhodococcus qingshengii]